MRNYQLATCTLSATIAIVLAACGGGGGGGMVKTAPAPTSPPTTPPAPAPPPPPPPANLGPCQMPITGDCIVSAGGAMLAGRTSDYALKVQLLLGDELKLGEPRAQQEILTPPEATYRFTGGTNVAGGTLRILFGNVLYSDLTVRPDADLVVSGIAVGSLSNDGYVRVDNELHGNVLNRGHLLLSGFIIGDVSNEGLFDIDADIYYEPNGAWPFPHSNAMSGNYIASPASTTSIALACRVNTCLGGLYVSGRATLAGNLLLHEYGDAWGPYPLPSAGTYQIIHADGGVFGTFDRWTSPGLFVEGGIRYGSNDVWFDLTRISVLTAASTNGLGNALTLASAGNLDRALAIADGFAGQPSAPQQAFLASASKLLWMHDPAQATRAIDSLSGAIHADALQSTADGAATRSLLGAHLDGVVRGRPTGAWLLDDGHGAISGVDQWLGPHLLAGVHASQRYASDAASASANDLSSGGYLRWFGDDGWYAGLDAGLSHRTLAVGRAIDFGNSGQWSVRSRRSMDAASGSIEAGRRLPLLGGSLTPFVGAGLSMVDAAAASEQGSSGFELQLADSRLRGSRASAGLRFARDWRWGNTRWLQLSAATGIDHRHWNGHQEAAFLGVPDAWFELPVSSNGRQRWASLGLQGGWGHGWAWMASRSSGGAFSAIRPWSLTLRRDW